MWEMKYGKTRFTLQAAARADQIDVSSHCRQNGRDWVQVSSARGGTRALEMAEFKIDVQEVRGNPTRNVRMTRLASGIDFEEEDFCERKVLEGSRDRGGGSRLRKKEVQD